MSKITTFKKKKICNLLNADCNLLNNIIILLFMRLSFFYPDFFYMR